MYLFTRSVRLGPGNPEKQMGWALKIYSSIAEVQRAGDALAADPSFPQKVDKELSKVSLPGAATQTLLRRVV